MTSFLESIDLDVVWPDDEHGGTIFDDAFEAYNTARKVELGFASASLAFFVASCLFDVCGRNKRGLQLSRLSSWVSLLSLFASILSTAMPNYLRLDSHSVFLFCFI